MLALLRVLEGQLGGRGAGARAGSRSRFFKTRMLRCALRISVVRIAVARVVEVVPCFVVVFEICYIFFGHSMHSYICHVLRL